MRKNFNYTDEHQSQISFPLGGIGTGCIGIAGNGHLRDWEIFNRPSKGSYNGLSHFALKVEDESGIIDARILNGDLQAPYTGQYGTDNFYEGFGWGPMRESLAGMPHFPRNNFRGTFPIAQLDFQDNNFPGTVSMEAFNPFIPHEEDKSSIPAAFFYFTIQNNQKHSLKFHLTTVIGNPYEGKPRNQFSQSDGISRIILNSLDSSPDNITSGNLCLATDSSNVSYQEYLYRGEWFDALEIYWKDTLRPGPFQNRYYKPEHRSIRDNALISCLLELEPGECGTIKFVISWYHPVNQNTWSKKSSESIAKDSPDNGQTSPEPPSGPGWKNYYSVLWNSAAESADYALSNWKYLHESTRKFRDAIFDSTLPECVIDAVSANLSVLKSPTVWRLEDGSLYGWEGVGEREGSCEGSCTHVWGYSQALPFLFPALSRSMRENEFRYNWAEDGSMTFRLMLPPGSPRWNFRPAADGFLVTIIKTFREWKICGEKAWLKRLWPKVKKSLEFIWSADNPDLWDPVQGGLLTGRQHHTLDMELFGPNAWLSGLYLTALKAGAEMAKALDDEKFAGLCTEIFARGQQRLNNELFNGNHFIQKINLKDRTILETYAEDDRVFITQHKGNIYNIYWSEELNELKYQIGEGSSIDQMLGQWHADICGLGEIFEPNKVRQALSKLMKYNFRRTMRNYYNPCRIYALNDESGLIICAWPDENLKPSIPAPYSQETMHGFEYAAADFMIRRGLEKEGLEVIEAIRNRYDGHRRNPWNEIECGSNYARSMASYALLLTFSGFSFDGRSGLLSFLPRQKTDFSCFWSFKSAWGTVKMVNNRELRIHVLGGHFSLRLLGLPFPGSDVRHNNREIVARLDNNIITLDRELELSAGDELTVL